LSKAERELWKELRRERAKHTAEKRSRYGLRSNREALLFIVPPSKTGT
jgi:hypothetical protein